MTDLEMPRGKQYWRAEGEGIFYTRTTGIWQSVWIEAVEESYLEHVFITPDIDHQMVTFQFEIQGDIPDELITEISFEGTSMATVSVVPKNRMENSLYILINS